MAASRANGSTVGASRTWPGTACITKKGTPSTKRCRGHHRTWGTGTHNNSKF